MINSALLLTLLLLPYASFASRIYTTSAETENSVSVWSEFTFASGGAYSSVNGQPLEDCMRPTQVQCFSIQQNFWVKDKEGAFVFWVQNVVELARVSDELYSGTCTFNIWTPERREAPLLCEPESDDLTNCRSPFFSEHVNLPHSFAFYSHVVNDNPARIQMSNDFGSVEWTIPPSINCPCSIETTRHQSPPWGYFPFEFVMVGLDSYGVAVFKNNTSGAVGSTLVQLSDGEWYNSSIMTLHCSGGEGCETPTATAESSTNLQWNSPSGKVSWSNGALDQGIYLSSISNNHTAAPAIPSPRAETFLYMKLLLTLGYFAITDQ